MNSENRDVFRKIRDNFCAATAIVLALLPAARIFQGWVCRINSPREWDYGPAKIALLIRIMRHGGGLYNNCSLPPYPPAVLYNPAAIYLTAALTPLFSQSPIASLEAGRLLVVSSTIAVCILIFLVARRSGAAAGAALIVVLAFVLSPFLEPWGFEFRVDMPALACELAGLYLFQAEVLLPSVAVFVLAFFIKQSYVSGITAIALYSVLNWRWRRAFVLSALWLGAVGLLTAVLMSVFPYYFLNAYLALSPALNLVLAAGSFDRLLLWHFPLIALATVGVARHAPRHSLTVSYLLIALANNSLQCMRSGGALYYLLPTLAGLALVAARPLSDLIKQSATLSVPLKVVAGAAIAWTLVVPLWLGGITDIPTIRREIVTRDFACPYPVKPPWDERAFRLLDSLRGSVITDDFGLVLNHPARDIQGIDLWPLRLMFESGRFDDRPLVDDIEHRRIAAFALDQELLDRQWQGRKFFWPRLRKAILDNYVPVPGVGPPYLMIPKPSTGAPSSAR